MNINKWNEIYLNNKRLDDIFIKKYGDFNTVFNKNCIGLLVELGEFINETRVFKYWSVKKSNKDLVLEEFADVITSTLVFYNMLNLKIEEPKTHLKTNDILELFNYLFIQSSKLMNNFNSELVIDIFNNLFYAKELLNIKEEDILESINKKHKIIEERLNSNY